MALRGHQHFQCITYWQKTLTLAGEAFDVEVDMLHSYHLSFAHLPAAKAVDWSGAPFTVARALLIGY